MADTVTGPTILQENDKRVVIKIVNESDGTGGTTVFADVSALAANSKGDSVHKEYGGLVLMVMVVTHLQD